MDGANPPPGEGERASDDLRVGVVIPVYNRRTTLLDTLPYVVQQTLPPACLAIVDDGSTDGTAAAAEAWLANRRPGFPWQVIRGNHQSAAAARMLGLEQVRSLPLVTFLDSDDHWPSDFLERGAAALRGQPDAVAAVADRRFLDSDGEPLEADDCRQLASNPIEWFFQHGAGVTSCSVLRTDVVIAAGGWLEGYDCAEDAVLFCEMALRGAWVHLPGAAVEFHLGSARARREDHNLSRRSSDCHRRWVDVFEIIYQRVVARRPDMKRSALPKSMAQRWYWAGKQLAALDRIDEARQCFRRAIAWRPTFLRAWRRLAVLRVNRRALPASRSTRTAA
jgi:glycosyltransferase involved in cell wall biosynthesis